MIAEDERQRQCFKTPCLKNRLEQSFEPWSCTGKEAFWHDFVWLNVAVDTILLERTTRSSGLLGSKFSHVRRRLQAPTRWGALSVLRDSAPLTCRPRLFLAPLPCKSGEILAATYLHFRSIDYS